MVETVILLERTICVIDRTHEKGRGGGGERKYSTYTL
jgi:hypothetical protein